MIVKTLKRAAAVAAILSAATVANASVLGMKKINVGLDVMGTTLDFTDRNGKGIFPKNPIQFGAFVGADFYAHNEFGVGFELGVEYMQKTRKNASISAGQFDNSNANAMLANSSSTYNVKYRHISPYLGLTGSYKINEQFKLIGMVAGSLVFAEAKQSEVAAVAANIITDPAHFSTFPKYKKTAFAPIVRVGAQYNINEMFGIRANVSYRYMKGVNKQVTPTVYNGNTNAFVSNTGINYSMQAKNHEFTYGAGIVVSF